VIRNLPSDCATRALAIAFGWSYNEARQQLTKANRKWFSRKKVVDGAKHWAVEDVLKDAGWEEIYLGRSPVFLHPRNATGWTVDRFSP
jgi:hypothetical protein